MGKKKAPEKIHVLEGSPHGELYSAFMKLIEAEALEAGEARKEPSFYATFEGDKSIWTPPEDG
ncbi:MAG TPA: hypothetical protein VKM55_04280 [Candidatus Lokiarchaeia archaeon]|nr:hypothetical protein [Candidatus Lokiarchaeia archaeon]